MRETIVNKLDGKSTKKEREKGCCFLPSLSPEFGRKGGGGKREKGGCRVRKERKGSGQVLKATSNEGRIHSDTNRNGKLSSFSEFLCVFFVICYSCLLCSLSLSHILSHTRS